MSVPAPESQPAEASAAAPAIDRAAFFREHSGLALTAGYLGLIVVGMMYEFWLFWRFRISILYYAEAADFLLVPFREPLVILVATLPIVIFQFYMRGARWLATRVSKPGVKTLTPEAAQLLRTVLLVVNIMATLLWSLAATAKFAAYVANNIRKGERRVVRVVTAGRPEPISGTVIGTTSQWLFLYDPKVDQTRMIPVEQIAEILVDRKKPPRPAR